MRKTDLLYLAFQGLRAALCGYVIVWALKCRKKEDCQSD
nr:MAG TPA: hypothetical protein [Caudoviricetes sp.]